MPSTATIGRGDRRVTVHTAHDGTLPPVGPYIAEVWRRRRFVLSMAETQLKAANYDTFFGQLWQVLNPLLLAMVYYFIVSVLSGGNQPPGFLSYLVGGLFLYYYPRSAMGAGAGSVVGGGGLLLNAAFPRAILPLSATLSAGYNYVNTLVVFFVIFLIEGGSLHLQLLWLPPMVVLLTVMSFGLAMLSGVSTVYFRDTSSFLPYALRIWMYVSPVLFTYDDLVAQIDRMGAPAAWAPYIAYLNPLVPFLNTWHKSLEGVNPSQLDVLGMIVWALVMPLIGGYFFLSREREFAVRV
ncbi:MAG TPA: hypothetical protein VJ978_09210 [Nitriliruptoraceae bacterium]|nr:hypothetical protein [Nitriliruptoraceae bacterium]